MKDWQKSDLYVHIDITLEEGIPNGEYEYLLTVGASDKIISSGLLVIGENSRPSEYNKDITYEQYETE